MVEIVKIDGSFILNLADDPEDQMFVRTLQRLAKRFGFKTVAECVENEEIVKMLASEGVDYLQGYHFARPSAVRPWRLSKKSSEPLLYG